MRIRDAIATRNRLAAKLESLRENGEGERFPALLLESVVDLLDDIPEIEVVSLKEHEALQEHCRQLEKRLSDANSSPFDGGMSQKEYFHGETDCKRRERWVLVLNDTTSGIGGVRYRWKCTGCGAGIETEELRPPSEHRCYICGAGMDWGASDG